MEYHIPDLELLERGWKVKRGKEGEPHYLYRSFDSGWWIPSEQVWRYETQEMRVSEFAWGNLYA